jgi:hypothetical protein
MANSSFTGVSNEELVNKLGASNINAGTVTCDRLDISTPFSISSHILYITGSTSAPYTLTNAQISFAVSTGHLYVYADHTTGAVDINFGADTSARAAELLSLFGITNSLTSRLIRIKILNTTASGQAINIRNTANTITNVLFKDMTVSGGALVESATAGTKVLVAANAPRHAEGHILVKKGEPFTSGENAILFTLIEPCG